MPSPKGYKRDYKEEWATAKKRGEDKGNAERHVARRAEQKLGAVIPSTVRTLTIVCHFQRWI